MSALKNCFPNRYSPTLLAGTSAADFVISSTSRRKSSRPGAGIMIVSRRPLTSSVMRRKRPRGFSLRAKTNVFRSIWIFSVRIVSSGTPVFGPEKEEARCPKGDGRSFEIIHCFPLFGAVAPLLRSRYLSCQPANLGGAHKPCNRPSRGDVANVSDQSQQSQYINRLGRGLPGAVSSGGSLPLLRG